LGSTMRSSALVALIVAAAFAAANAEQTGLYPNFPFCKCVKTPSSYTLSPSVRALGGGKYCFTLNAVTPPGCTSYCCTKADLKKLEFNVNQACDVFGATVKATVNGIATKVGPSFSYAPDGPVGSTVLRITQLGLSRADDGAEICLTLLPSKAGEGCTTLEDLCVPPTNSAPGVCTVAAFDSQNDCCPISNVNVPSPPPPSPRPPSPRPPSPRPPSPPPPSPPPPSPPPPSPPPPSPPPPSPPPPSPPPPSPPPPSPPPPSPRPPNPPPPSPSPPPPSPPPPSPPPPSPPPPSPSPPSPPPPSPPPPSPPPPSPPPPSPPPPPPPSPKPPSPSPPSPPPPSPPPPSPPPPSPPPPRPPPPSPPPPNPPPPSPPPPNPPPPSPPPPSPPPPCSTCAYIFLVATSPSAIPYSFTAEDCVLLGDAIGTDLAERAATVGARILTPFQVAQCGIDVIKVCGTFFSDADGALLQPLVDELLAAWINNVLGGSESCPESLLGYDVTSAIGGDSNIFDIPISCLNGQLTKQCLFPPPPPSPLPPSPKPPSPRPPSPPPPSPPPPSPPPP
ncbi:hypothetical protein VaNZ11_008370, partial [Volvox africanus]